MRRSGDRDGSDDNGEFLGTVLLVMLTYFCVQIGSPGLGVDVERWHRHLTRVPQTYPSVGH